MGRARAALLRQGLSELGWTEGRNIHIDYRWAGGDAAQAEANAAELVSQKPDVIVANSTSPRNRASMIYQTFVSNHLQRVVAAGGFIMVLWPISETLYPSQPMTCPMAEAARYRSPDDQIGLINRCTSGRGQMA